MIEVTLKDRLDELPFCYYHNDLDGCGEIAFYLRRKLILGEQLVAEDAVWPSGEDAINGEEVICPNCKRIIYPLKIEHIKATKKEK